MADNIDFREKLEQKLNPNKAGLASEPEMAPAEVSSKEGPDAGTKDHGKTDQTETEEGQHQKAEMEPVEKSPSKSQKRLDQILGLFLENAELFHTPENEAYVTVGSGGRHQTWPVRSKEFRQWLQRIYYREYHTILSERDLQNALQQMEGIGCFDGPTLNVYLRYAGCGDEIYIDLANDACEQIRVTQDGWNIVSAKDSPVKFKRTQGMLPLCYPGQEAASMEDIGRFFNVKNPDDLVLIVAWLLGAMKPEGPFPPLALQGEQGSAKSTATRYLKDLVDPATPPLRTPPSCERDLAIAASKTWVLSFDNLSGLSSRLSDALCRLATGSGLCTRAFYTNDEEIRFNASRPTILNGISDIATRHDLADRALFVHLPPISKATRMAERDLEKAWAQAKPAILRTLLGAMVVALRKNREVLLPRLPRMADFARWVTAAEEGLGWPEGTFMKAYEANRMNLIDQALEADVVATAIINLMARAAEWSGTPTELYEILKRFVPDYERKSTAWPRAANILSGRLVRAQTFLRSKAIEIERGKSGNRIITIRRTLEKIAPTVHSVETPGAEKPSPQRSYRVGDLTYTPQKFRLLTTMFRDVDASDDKGDTQSMVKNDAGGMIKPGSSREEEEI